MSFLHHVGNKQELFKDIFAIILALSRFIEPFILNSFFLDLKDYLPMFYKRMWNKKDSKLPLCLFSASAMNVEYVYLIITGVTQLIDINEVKDSEDHDISRIDRDNVKIDKNGKDIMIKFKYIKLDDIEMKDFDIQQTSVISSESGLS